MQVSDELELGLFDESFDLDEASDFTESSPSAVAADDEAAIFEHAAWARAWTDVLAAARPCGLVVLAGQPRSGKTTMLRRAGRELVRQGLNVGIWTGASEACPGLDVALVDDATKFASGDLERLLRNARVVIATGDGLFARAISGRLRSRVVELGGLAPSEVAAFLMAHGRRLEAGSPGTTAAHDALLRHAGANPGILLDLHDHAEFLASLEGTGNLEPRHVAAAALSLTNVALSCGQDDDHASGPAERAASLPEARNAWSRARTCVAVATISLVSAGLPVSTEFGHFDVPAASTSPLKTPPRRDSEIVSLSAAVPAGSAPAASDAKTPTARVQVAVGPLSPAVTSRATDALPAASPHVTLSFPSGDRAAQDRRRKLAQRPREHGYAVPEPIPRAQVGTRGQVEYLFANVAGAASNIVAVLGGEFGKGRLATKAARQRQPRMFETAAPPRRSPSREITPTYANNDHDRN